jgi:hypothetical protein
MTVFFPDFQVKQQGQGRAVKLHQSQPQPPPAAAPKPPPPFLIVPPPQDKKVGRSLWW